MQVDGVGVHPWPAAALHWTSRSARCTHDTCAVGTPGWGRRLASRRALSTTAAPEASTLYIANPSSTLPHSLERAILYWRRGVRQVVRSAAPLDSHCRGVATDDVADARPELGTNFPREKSSVESVHAELGTNALQPQRNRSAPDAKHFTWFSQPSPSGRLPRRARVQTTTSRVAETLSP